MRFVDARRVITRLENVRHLLATNQRSETEIQNKRRLRVKIVGYKIHPAADLVPEMTTEEYEQLRDSIKDNGQYEPVWTWRDGSILDGRHRLKACLELRKVPRVQCYKDDDPVEFVKARSLYRRNLLPGQRAALAAALIAMGVEPGRARRKRGEIVAAARQAGVARSTVQRAVTLQEAAPEESKRVREGTKTLTQAERDAGILPARDAAPKEPEPIAKDRLGSPLTEQARPAFDGLLAMKDMANAIQQCKRDVTAAVDWPCMAATNVQEVLAQLTNAWRSLIYGMPFAVCPPALMVQAPDTLGVRGWLTEAEYKRMPKNRSNGQ